jgi:hypothetical protein
MPITVHMYQPVPKCRDFDYIDFFIASPKAFCCKEAAKVQPESPDAPAHDAFTRLLHRLEPDPAALWIEAQPMVQLVGGLLVLDDSTLDKHYAKKIDLVGRHWSGKHKRVVWGINLITIVSTPRGSHTPTRTAESDKFHLFGHDIMIMSIEIQVRRQRRLGRNRIKLAIGFELW